MIVQKIRYENVRFDPRDAMFETRVTVKDAGFAYVYPVRARLPVHSEYDEVVNILGKNALAMHGSERKHTHLFRPLHENSKFSRQVNAA